MKWLTTGDGDDWRVVASTHREGRVVLVNIFLRGFPERENVCRHGLGIAQENDEYVNRTRWHQANR
jgi:hypothetical protein